MTPKIQESYKDSVWATVRGQDNSDLLIGVIYSSGTPHIANTADHSLHTTIAWAASHNSSHKLLAGDFNHPVISWTPSPVLPIDISPNSSHTKFIECIRDSYLHQHVTQPTRFRDE